MGQSICIIVSAFLILSNALGLAQARALAQQSTGGSGDGNLSDTNSVRSQRAPLLEAVEPWSLTLDASSSVTRITPSIEQDVGDPSKTAADPPAATAGYATILFEDAEGSFPADNGWSVYDANASNGSDYWDDLSCRSFGGSWSVWCADIGDQTNCSNYDDNMQSWMIYGPFSLADADAARAEFYVWSETERPDIPYDYLFWGASTNGTNFSGYRLTANVAWSFREFDFASVPTLGDLTGEAQVWFAFVFTSDSSVNNYEGSYVDDILIEKRIPTDLEALDVFFRDQPDNGGNVIDNPTPSDVLYPHITYVIHGSADVSGKLWQIEINNQLLCSFTATRPPSTRYGYCTSPITLAPGLHSLHGEVDPDQTIAETNGSNNDVYHNYDVGGEPEIRVEPTTLNFSPATAPISVPPAQTESVATPEIRELVELRQQTVERLQERAEREGSVPVIVGLELDWIGEGHLADPGKVAAQRNAIAQAQERLLAGLAGLDVELRARFRYIPFLALEVGPAGLAALASFPEVTSIEEDVADRPLMASSNPVVGSPTAWASGFTGTGQSIAVLDSGVDGTHAFFSTGGNKIVSEACYSTPSGTTITSLCPGGTSPSTAAGSGVNCPTTLSGCSHGTHVAGSAAGDDGSGPNFGVGRGADIIAIQVFRRYTSATTCSPNAAPCILSASSDQISALERVYDLRNTFNIAAVNMSLGGGQYTSEATCDAANTSRKAAVDNLRSVGIATVAAAGNDGYRNAMGAPACISTVVGVGGTTDADGMYNLTNVAPFVSLLAPGVSITSSVPGGGTSTWNGTSMATPHVAGAWAILKQADPSLSVDDALTALRDTGTSVDDNRSGGSVTDMRRINIDQALGQVGSASTQPFTIYNDGSSTLSVTSIQLQTSASWISWSPEAPFDIAAGGSQAVAVTVDFAAAPTGQTSRRLLIASNDGDESPYPGGVYVNVDKPDAGAPDLIVTNLNVSDTTPATGQSFTTSATVRNQGDAASDPTTLRYYRSSDAVISPTDTEMSTDGVTALAPGGSDSESDAHSVGAAGTYWIGACVDPVPGESNTGNNCTSGIQIVVGSPDLIVTNVGVSDPSPGVGQSFDTSATVRNQGDAASGATTLRYYRSSDAVISSADTQLSTDAVGALAPGGTSPEVDPHSIGTAGTYWIGACVDVVGNESNTSNNCSAGVQVVVGDGCTEPQNLTLDNTDLQIDATYQACDTIYLGPNLTISAHIILRAGGGIEFHEPVTVMPGANLEVHNAEPVP